MFESDDWDLDQDFLNDVDEKSSIPYFPPDNNESKPKRRKVEITNHSSFPSNQNVNWCEKKTVDKTAKCNEDKVSRKNLILGMFNKNLTDKNVSQGTLSNSKNSSQNNLSKPHSNHSSAQQSCENIQLTRKHLVHEILKKKYIEDNVTKNNATNLESRKTELKIKSNNNINVEQQESALLNNKIKYETLRKNFQENNCSNNDNTKQRSSESSKKQLLCNVLKQRSMDNVEFKSKCSIKPLEVQSNKKMTLVRRFPGPAGLLPDDIDTNVSSISYLKSLEENESTVETNNTHLLEYCSQNTKDLFTEGAWQLMLDDLPDGFLKGYEIATVKQMANANGYNNTKIDFLAGIVEHIDHSYDNPPIVLKDFTGSIQGIVHRDIPLKYSGLLESNVVILLCDVGLLKTSESFFSNKYQILISPSNLLAIYSNKGKIERTQYMESIVGNVSNEEAKEEEIKIDHSPTRTLKEKSLKIDSKFDIEHINNIKKATTSAINTRDSTKKSSSSSTNLNKTFENMNESIDFDPIHVSFSVSSNKITDSQTKNFISPASINFKHINEENKKQSCKELIANKKQSILNDCQQKSGTLLQTLTKFSPNVNASKKFSHNPKVLQMDVNHSMSTSAHSEEVETKLSNDRITEIMDIVENDVNISKNTESVVKKLQTPCNDTAESIQFNNTIKKNKRSVCSRLLQFKNTDALTASQNSEYKSPLDLKKKNEILQDNKLLKITNLSPLYNTENDSDDEILSQLDMDTIFSNYNNES